MIEKKKEHAFPSLTGMRGIACLFIVCFHYFCLYIDNLGFGTEALPFSPYSEFFFVYSKNAVELFFMLSGFLTAYHSREKNASISLWEYLKKCYGKLIIPSVIVNLWALVNALIILRIIPGSDAFISPITPIRIVLSVLMLNTGWFASYKQTALPLNSTIAVLPNEPRKQYKISFSLTLPERKASYFSIVIKFGLKLELLRD